ncbi:MAG: hypothetical protein HRT89_09655 [Lentisphaeria bacterium]|nr:hypothetical protein [Lentisphaeria bacterium]NQZ68325.1 hypothetical protein [Lentisphaeria bacterium]
MLNMKIRIKSFLIISILLPVTCGAKDYYIDSVGGSDRKNGRSKSSAWKSHKKVESASLKAGDVVHFKRGSSFSGSLVIKGSGKKSKPIRLTSYGTGALPKFTNSSTRDASGNAIILRGDYIIVENLHFHDTPGEKVSGMLIMTKLAALRIEHGSDHCIIRNNEFIKTGQGIMSAGEHTLITRNYLDGPSYALWRTAKSSWGPMGIHLNIGNQEVSYNIIKNFGTKDSPWGSDGGAIEIDFGKYHKKNIYIHHNYSEGNAGFLESSWDYDWPRFKQEIFNWRVSFNICYDGQSWLFMLAPCTGIDGRPLPKSGSWDIGAIQYSATKPSRPLAGTRVVFVAKDAMRTWTMKNGKKIKGAMIPGSLKRGYFKVKKENGFKFNIKVSSLSDADKKFLEQ